MDCLPFDFLGREKYSRRQSIGKASSCSHRCRSVQPKATQLQLYAPAKKSALAGHNPSRARQHVPEVARSIWVAISTTGAHRLQSFVCVVRIAVEILLV